jgi:D-alanyl-D-alanine endopeptidase (penicillin-binding protein 7)
MTTQHLITSLGWTLLHFVWQGALVGCMTAALLALLRNAKPEQRYAVACLALLVCLAWPVAELVHQLQAGPLQTRETLILRQGAIAGAPSGRGGLPAWLGAHLGWIVMAWAVCTALLALRTALGLAWVSRMRRAPAADAAWQACVSRLAERFGLAREVGLRIVDDLASPVTAGWWRPVILVPASLVSGMSPDLLEALLAHELAHVSRHDYLVNLAQNVVETLLFYHPAVWWISRRIRAERELVADGLAARRLGEPRRLALALSELERLQFGGGHLAVAASGGDLAMRIRRLVRPETRPLQWQAALPILALAVACIANAHVPQPERIRVGLAAPAKLAHRTSAFVDFNSCDRPVYPKAALAAGQTGTVTILFRIGADGTVQESKVQRSSGHPSLDAAAQSALAKCRFTAALRDGQPIEKWQPVQYVWTLD